MKSLSSTMVLIIMMLSARSAMAGPEGKPSNSMAIWRLKPLGLDRATADRLEGLLRTEAGHLKGVIVQEKGETVRLLATRSDLQACGGKTFCLCKIGKVLHVDRLVTGVIGALGDDYTFDLKLLDVSSCYESRRINEALSGRKDLLISAIRKSLYKLVAPELVIGSLLVDVPVDGASVLLDGKELGKTPLPKAISGLRPGLHRLKISGKGFSEFSEDVPVRFQQTTMLRVDLVKSVLTGLSYEKEEKGNNASDVSSTSSFAKAEKPSSTLGVLAWSSAGLALVAAGAAGVLGWRADLAESEVEQAANADPAYINSSYEQVFHRGQTYALGSNIAWAIAGGAAVASVVMFLVDLFSDAPPGAQGMDGNVGQNQSLMISPGIGPSGGSVNLEMHF